MLNEVVKKCVKTIQGFDTRTPSDIMAVSSPYPWTVPLDSDYLRPYYPWNMLYGSLCSSSALPTTDGRFETAQVSEYKQMGLDNLPWLGFC